MAEGYIQIEVEDSRTPHENTPLLKNPDETQQSNHPDEQENDKETLLDKTLQRLDFFLCFLGFNQSSAWSFLASWGLFLVVGVLLPVVMLELSNCPGCEKGQVKSFEIGIVVSQACLAASALMCLSHNLRKYGVRKFLFVDRYSGHVERFSGQYVQKISVSNTSTDCYITFIYSVCITSVIFGVYLRCLVCLEEGRGKMIVRNCNLL